MSFSKKFAQIFVSTFTILNVRVSPWEKILAQQTLSTGQTKFQGSLSLEGFYLCFFCIAIKYCQHIFEKKVIVLKPELIYVANITNYIHGEKIVMWRNFSFPCMTIVGKLKISPHVEKFQYNWWGFIAIYAVLLLNLLFTLFCCKIFATFYALSYGEKLSPRVHLWRKNDKYQVWVILVTIMKKYESILRIYLPK